MNFIKKINIPTCGVALGFAALGNLVQAVYTNLLEKPETGNMLRGICGWISGILLVLFILKLIFDFSGFKKELEAPPVAAVFGTFSMALMLISTYLKPYIGALAKVIWIFAIALHLFYIIMFSVKMFKGFKMQKVFASWFIVYCGIVVASVTAEAFEMTATVGTWMFWIGFILGVLSMILATYRYIKFPEKPEPTKPLFCIYAAPLSLCTAGYITSVAPKNIGFIIALAIVSFAIYVIVLISLVKWLKMPFFPSYAAFTFPFVISGIAMAKTLNCLGPKGLFAAGVIDAPVIAKGSAMMMTMRTVVFAETIIAAVLCVYTLIRFIMFFTKKADK